jgi:hypothetical protein
MADPTEATRRVAVLFVNANQSPRADYETKYGKDNVFDTDELGEHFTVNGFLAPFVSVTRKSDGKRGLLCFRHRPRLYFDFRLEEDR